MDIKKKMKHSPLYLQRKKDHFSCNRVTQAPTYKMEFSYRLLVCTVLSLASSYPAVYTQETVYDCPSTVDMSWGIHSPAVYLQQWEGSYPTSGILQEFFSEPSNSWNQTFSQLRGIQNHNALAFCPWTYTTNYNEKRIPQFLPMMKCQSCRCLDNFNTPRGDVVCTPFNYNLLVLLQNDGDECYNGRKTYSPSFIDVPVACICLRNARPK